MDEQEKKITFFSNFMESLSDDGIKKGIKARRRKLVSRLLADQQRGKESSTLVRIFEKKTKKEYMDSLQKGCQDEGISFEAFSSNPPAISFYGSGNNKRLYTCDFICIEYYRFYQVSKEWDAIRRYVYFELYYRDYVAACIMNAKVFKNDMTFVQLDMDRATWAAAKQQMAFWNRLFSPEIKSLPLELRPLGSALVELLQGAKETAKRRDDKSSRKQTRKIDYSNEDQLVWPLVTYLTLFRLLPILFRNLRPDYVLNFVCPEGCKDMLSRKMQVYMGRFFDEVPEIALPILSEAPKESSKEYRATPYILDGTKKQNVRSILRKIESFAVKPDRDWRKHPFSEYVPLLISCEPEPSSAVLNIFVSKEDIDASWSDTAEMKNRFEQVFATLSIKYLNQNDSNEENRKKSEKIKSIGNRYNKLRLEIGPELEEKMSQSDGNDSEWYDSLIPSQERVFSLGVFFSLFYFTGYESLGKKDVSKASEWMYQVLKRRKRENQSLERIANRVLTKLSSFIENASGKRPENKDDAKDSPPFLYSNRSASKDDSECLSCGENWLRKLIENCSDGNSPDDIIGHLGATGYLRVNKTGETKKRQCMHAIKLGRDNNNVWFYSFHLQKLKEFNSQN